MYRNEREALTAQLKELQHGIAGAREELQSVDAECDALTAEVNAGARKAVPRLGHGVMRVVAGLTIVAATMVLADSCDSCETEDRAAMFFGRVKSASGTPPVKADARCVVTSRPYHRKNSEYNARVSVSCGGRIIYGKRAEGISDGALTCEWKGRGVSSCRDDEVSRQSGDPKLLLDRNTNTVTLEEPEWRVVIALEGA